MGWDPPFRFGDWVVCLCLPAFPVVTLRRIGISDCGRSGCSPGRGVSCGCPGLLKPVMAFPNICLSVGISLAGTLLASNMCAMLSNMICLLPIGNPLDVAIHCSYGTNSQDPLIWEEGQYQNHCFTPAPLSPMCFQELMQSSQIDEDGQNEAIEW